MLRFLIIHIWNINKLTKDKENSSWHFPVDRILTRAWVQVPADLLLKKKTLFIDCYVTSRQVPMLEAWQHVSIIRIDTANDACNGYTLCFVLHSIKILYMYVTHSWTEHSFDGLEDEWIICNWFKTGPWKDEEESIPWRVTCAYSIPQSYTC